MHLSFQYTKGFKITISSLCVHIQYTYLLYILLFSLTLTADNRILQVHIHRIKSQVLEGMKPNRNSLNCQVSKGMIVCKKFRKGAV